MNDISTSDLIVSVPGFSYRSRDEVQSIRKTRDPIMSLREKLLDSGLADTDDIKVSNTSFYRRHGYCVRFVYLFINFTTFTPTDVKLRA